MKNQFAPCGTTILYLLLFLSICNGCKKSDDVGLSSSLTSIKVIAVSPASDHTDSPYDREVTATLNTSIDTTRFVAAITVFQNDVAVPGTVSITDSVISFSPEVELLPSTEYTASMSLDVLETRTKKLAYTWSFSTKEADSFKMTKRSDAVTDFVRDGSRSMQIGQYLYSFGGWNVPEESYNDVYRSKDDLTVWEKLPDAPWHGRHVYGIAKIADSTYIIGGDNLHSVFDVWRTTDGVSWLLLATNILDNRIYYGCTVHNGYIYVVGGSGYSDVWRSRNGISWEQVAQHVAFLNNESFPGSLASFNGRLWMVCGGTDGYGTGGPIRKEVWSSIDGKEWQKEKDFAGTKRYYTDVCVWDNKLWVVGGYNFEEGNIRSIWYMKPDGNWQELQVPDNYIGRHATGVAVYNNHLVITCGNYNNDCWVIEKVK